MNVASLETSVELHNLIGGSVYGSDKTWRRFQAKRTGSTWYSPEQDYTDGWQDPLDGRRATAITHHIEAVAPAYEADYLGNLLRDLDFTIVNLNHKNYSLTSDSLDDPDAAILGDSLAELLANFAVEAFKQGVLTRDGDA